MKFNELKENDVIYVLNEENEIQDIKVKEIKDIKCTNGNIVLKTSCFDYVVDGNSEFELFGGDLFITTNAKYLETECERRVKVAYKKYKDVENKMNMQKAIANMLCA